MSIKKKIRHLSRHTEQYCGVYRKVFEPTLMMSSWHQGFSDSQQSHRRHTFTFKTKLDFKCHILLTSHTGWNVSQILYVYPSGKEPVESICEGEATAGRWLGEPYFDNLVTKMWQKIGFPYRNRTFQCTVEKILLKLCSALLWIMVMWFICMPLPLHLSLWKLFITLL